jgi:thioredoxin 1
MSLRKVGDDEFEAEVIQSDCLTVVDFGAEWCGPCKKLHPILEELAGQFDGRIKIVEVDVGESPKVAMKYGVTSVPQLFFVRDGTIRETVVGLMPRSKIEEKIEKYL